MRQDFLQNYYSFYNSYLERQTGLHASDARLREQFWFYNHMTESSDVEYQQEVQEFLHTFGSPALKAFIAVEEDQNAGKHLIDLSKNIDQALMKELLNTFEGVAMVAEDRSKELLEAIGGEQQSGLTESGIMNGLLVRAKELLSSAHQKLQHKNIDEQRKAIQEIIQQIQVETHEEQILSGAYRSIADIFGERNEGTLDLVQTQQQNDALLRQLEKRNMNGLFLRALSEKGQLAPIPDLSWRVDRDLEEYRRRFGLDVIELLRGVAEPGQKKILLEFGPGSGKSKAQRKEAGLSEYYNDVAMAREMLYPLKGLIENVVDWEKLQNELGEALPLSEEDKSILSEMLYKVVMIKDGTTGDEHVQYAEERIQELTQNPNHLRRQLQEIAPQLSNIQTIPSTISNRTPEAELVYPYKINVSGSRQEMLTPQGLRVDERSLGFLAAKEVLAQQMQTMLKSQDELPDYYDAIPAYPHGLMVGDFLQNIPALKDNQIDVAMGVRSTVYVKGEGFEDYVEFMSQMTRKLKSGGIYIDDNVRDNDGYNYRLAELLRVARKSSDDISFHIVLGPGFEGEDRQQERVPLAVVMQKDARNTEFLQQLIRDNEGFELVELKRYIQDQERIGQLDVSGDTLKRIQELQ